MGVWQGIAQAYKDISAERAAEKEREEDRAFQKEMLMKKIGMEFKSNILKTRLDRATSSESADAIASSAKILKSRGVDSDIIKTLVSTGDAEGIARIASGVEKQYQEAESVGRGGEYILTVNEALKSGEYTPSTTKNIFEGLGADFQDGGAFSAENLGLDSDMTYTVPGAAYVNAPVFVEQPSLEDLGKLEERVIKKVTATATVEEAKIDKAVGEVARLMEEADEADLPFLQNMAVSLSSRQSNIQKAKEEYKELKDPSTYLKIYGTQAVDSVLQFDKRFTFEDLDPTFQQGLNFTPMVVQGQEQAKFLRGLGYDMAISYPDENGKLVVYGG